MPDVKETLIVARQLLAEPRNWKQRAFGKDNCFCIVGAVAKALGKPPLDIYDHPVVIALHKASGLTGEEDHDVQLFSWNDDPDRKHPEILALLDKAIAA